MSRKLKDLPHSGTVKKMLNGISNFAKTNPNKIPELSRELEGLIEKLSDKKHNFEIIPIKGEYIVVLGNLFTKEENIRDIANVSGVKEIKFFPDVDKLGNLAQLVQSERCIGVIIGGAPHSLPEDVENNFKDKFFPAISGEKRKITNESFKEALKKLMLQRTHKYLEIQRSQRQT